MEATILDDLGSYEVKGWYSKKDKAKGSGFRESEMEA